MVKAVFSATLGCLIALLGCAEDKVVPRTQLMLVADTDIALIDRIAFQVSGAGQSKMSEDDVDGADAPFTMNVLRESGPLGPVTVSARAYRGDRLVVERSAVVSFVPGKTLMVPLHLVQSCAGRQCGDGMVCTEEGCQPAELDSDTLAIWNGTPPRLGEAEDAGTFDADTLVADAGAALDAAPNPAQCSGRSVDLNSDLDHCGGCGRPCRSTSGQNTVPACVEGSCTVACRPLWDDCDQDRANGCEEYLGADEENCGACGMQCASSEYCSLLGSCRPSSSGQN
jgi:hypothetical protein